MRLLLAALLALSLIGCTPRPEKTNAEKAARSVIVTTPAGSGPAAATGAAAGKAAAEAAQK